MKKGISFLLVLVLLFSLCACSANSSNNSSNAKVVGVWMTVKDHESYMDYVYIYENGTGDLYGPWMGKVEHSSSFEWEMDGEYFCWRSSFGGVSKYTVKDGKMYDSQGKVAFALVSRDTSKDIPID